MKCYIGKYIYDVWQIFVKNDKKDILVYNEIIIDWLIDFNSMSQPVSGLFYA